MKNFISFLLVLLYSVIAIVGILGVLEIKHEEAEVRSVWEKMLREMAAEGYLDESIASHYTKYLVEQGYQQSIPYFQASHSSAGNRAIRPQHGEVVTTKNIVSLTVEVEPKPFIKAIKFLRDGQPNFTFTGTRLSEYLQQDGG